MKTSNKRIAPVRTGSVDRSPRRHKAIAAAALLLLSGAAFGQSCNAGSFSMSGLEPCDPAPVGSFISGIGATVATPCSPGTYQSLTGATACINAPAGRFVNASGSSAAQLCAVGSFQNNVGSTSCNAAPVGTFISVTGATAAQNCPAGSFQNLTGQTACLPSPAGSFVNVTGASSAQVCALGTFQNSTGSTSCTASPVGTFVSSTGATSAQLCAAGTFQNSTGSTTCATSPAGTFVSVTGASAAQACAVGTYQNVAGQTSCLLSAPGSFVSATGSTTAQLCSPGTYQSAAGQSSCTPASEDFFVSTSGATAQSACPAGTYQTTIGSVSCIVGTRPITSSIPVLSTGAPGGTTTPPVLNMGSGVGPAALGDLVSVLSNTQKLPLSFVAQSPSGAIVLSGFNGANLSFAPLQYQSNDPRPNGLYPLGNGQYQVVANGASILVAPAVQNLSQLTALLPPGTQATVNSNGVMSAKVNGVTYVVRPDVLVQLGANPGRTAALTTGSDGLLRFVDQSGNTQVLRPAFLEPDFLLRTLQTIDVNATSSVEADGTASIRFQGKNWILVPDATLGGVPAERSGDYWWQEDANRFRVRILTNFYDRLSQGFTVRQ